MDYDIIGNTSIHVWRGSIVEIALDREFSPISRIFQYIVYSCLYIQFHVVEKLFRRSLSMTFKPGVTGLRWTPDNDTSGKSEVDGQND